MAGQTRLQTRVSKSLQCQYGVFEGIDHCRIAQGKWFMFLEVRSGEELTFPFKSFGRDGEREVGVCSGKIAVFGNNL